MTWAAIGVRGVTPSGSRNGNEADPAVPTVNSLDGKTQDDRIDVLALINDENEDGIVLIVEDKVGDS